MPTYRIYWFDRADLIIHVDSLTAATDEKARAAVEADSRSLESAAMVEIWRGVECITRVRRSTDWRLQIRKVFGLRCNGLSPPSALPRNW
jgi:hypothetical protein